MDRKCEICGNNIYSYNSQQIEFDGLEIDSCSTCYSNFKTIFESDSENVEKSKRYFSSLEHGRMFSEINVNGYKIHFVKSRDDFDANDIKNISENNTK